MSVLVARGVGVRRGRRWIFRDLDVAVEAGEIVAVVGPPGSGRTTVLLALARRFRLSAGRVEVAGGSALGFVPEVEHPEPVFTVVEHVRERLALLGRPRAEAAAVPLHGLDPDRRGRELTPYEKQVLGLILARMSGPAVIALDGFDDGLDGAERAGLMALLAEISAAGTAILLTAREIDESRVHAVVRLGADPRPALDSRPAESVVVHSDVDARADGLNQAADEQVNRAEEAVAGEVASVHEAVVFHSDVGARSDGVNQAADEQVNRAEEAVAGEVRSVHEAVDAVAEVLAGDTRSDADRVVAASGARVAGGERKAEEQR